MKHFNILNKLPLYILNICLVFLCVFLVFFTVSLITGSGPKTTDSTSNYEDTGSKSRNVDNPNVVSVGLVNAMDQLGRNLKSTGDKIGATTKYAAETAGNVAVVIAKQTANIVVTAVQQTAKAVFFVVKGTANIIFYTFKTTALAGKSVANFFVVINVKAYGYVLGPPTRFVTSVIREPVFARLVTPSEYIADAPIIDPYSPEIQKAIVALAEEDTAQPEVKAASILESARVRWPATGKITTQFGVPHWPYQPVHTGLDISSQTASGVNPIYPFRAGKVIKTVKSSAGLGNHVEVDHGNGITSVYAHLASIAVAEGQQVTIDTELGREGTTGVSTGVHLHFEIRINGQATDPTPFLNG